MKKQLCTLATIASLGLLPAPMAVAGNEFFGALVGGALGAAIVNGQPKRVVTSNCGPKCRARAAQRQHNREMQTALNYFGYGAGAVDGAVGPGTRRAVARFQASTGYPATGYIQDHERAFLVSSYNRAVATGQIGSPQLLVSYKQQATQPVVQQPQQQLAVQPAPQQQQQQQPQTVVVNAPGAEPEAAPEGGLNSLGFGAAPVQASIASHCNKTALVTSSNGGYVTVSTITDASFTLTEQFCLARTYAISASEQLIASIPGLTVEQVQAQCESFAPAMRPYITSISGKSTADATADLQQFVAGSGMNPAQLATNSRICLGLGYRIDNAEVALASALVLVGVGETAYAEMLGHHLIHGYAAPANNGRGADWIVEAANALQSGSTPFVTPSDPTRPALLNAAATGIGGTSLPEVVPAAAAPAATFGMPKVTTQSN